MNSTLLQSRKMRTTIRCLKRNRYLIPPRIIISSLLLCLATTAVQAQLPGARMLGTKPADWQPAPQPDLETALKAAPALTVTDLVVHLDQDIPDERKKLAGPTRVWMQNPYYALNADGSWDVILVYQNGYLGHKNAVIHDYGTGTTTVQELRSDQGDDPLQTERYSFHLRQRFQTNGRLFFNAGSGKAMVVVYEPALNRYTQIHDPFGGEVRQGRYALGDDGHLYGVGWTKDASGFVCFKMDTKTDRFTRIADLPCANTNRREIYMDCSMSGDWIYAAAGAKPWQLVGFNVKTGEGRVLAETGPITGDHNTVRLSGLPGGVTGSITGAARVADLPDADAQTINFWLRDGKLLRRERDTAPWMDQPYVRPRPPFRWFRADPGTRFQQFPKQPPPELDQDSLRPDAAGQVSVRYRRNAGAEWEQFDADVQRYPGICRFLMEIDDHRLLAKDESYGQAVVYNLDTGSVYRNDDITRVSTYSLNMFRGKPYLSGYPSSRVWELDVSRISPDGKELPAAAGQTPVAREVGVVAKHSGVHMTFATDGGSDGRIYTSGTTVGRRRNGGGMGWVDPVSGETGGLWEPFSAYRTFWSCAALDGRYIIWSAKPTEDALKPDYTPEAGRLLIWDVEKQDFAAQIDSPGGGVCGPVVEVFPGYVIGHASSKVLYGLDVTKGEILWTKPVPVAPVTAFSQRRRHRHEFRLGPNGRIWTFLGDVLATIDPRDATVTPIGRVPDQAGAAQLAFAKGDVYLAGGSHLLRIADVKTGGLKEMNPPANSDPARVTALIGGRLIDGRGATPVEDAVVVVRGAKIVAAAPRSEVTIPRDAEMIDVTGLSILPGLIDSHFHSSNDVKRPVEFELKRGITSFRDPGHPFRFYDLLFAAREPVPRVFLCGAHLDGPPPVWPNQAIVIKSEEHARKSVNAHVDRGASAIKVYFRLPLEHVKTVCEAAEERGVLVTAHLELVDADAAIRAGVRGIEHVTSFGTALAEPEDAERFKSVIRVDSNARGKLRHWLWSRIDLDSSSRLTPLLDLIVEHEVFVSPTLGVFERRAGQRNGTEEDARAFANMLRFVRLSHEAGAPVVVGSHTKVPFGEPGRAYQRELELLVELGMTPMEAITAGTLHGARFLGIADRLGTIEAGKTADLILVKGDPSRDIGVIGDVKRVMLNGTWVAESP